MGYFWVLITFVRMCAPSDVPCQDMCTLGYIIMTLHDEMILHGTLMMSCHDVVMMS